MSDGPPPKRLRLSKEQLTDMGKTEIIEHLLSQDSYLDVMEAKALDGQNDNFELVCLRESEEKMKQQQLEATRRENVLVMRLTTKEQEMQEYANQIQELKQAQIPGVTQLRSTLVDPAVNLMFERMKKELEATKAKLEDTQNDLSAWKFTPDSNTGKRLMAKCRLLHQENEELGKIISSGRVAKLEADLALQRNFSEEMKKSQAEFDEFLMELDEDVEGMQSTIYYLQQQLREAKDSISKLQQDNHKLRTSIDSFKSVVTSGDEQLVVVKSEGVINSSHGNRMLDIQSVIVKEEADSISCTSPLSATDDAPKDKYINESSTPYDEEPSEKTEIIVSVSETSRNIRTPPSYTIPNSTLITSVGTDEDEEEASLDVDTVEKTGDDATETNGDDNASHYTSEISRSPCTPVTKSPLCKDHSNGETVDEENISDVDSTSMDVCTNNCSNSVQSDGDNAVRHWSSVNGVTHGKNSGE